MFEPLVAALITGAVRMLTGVRARWVGSGPDTTQRIYYSNHTSHVDFVLLWSALPPQLRARTRPVAAGDYWTKDAVRRYVIHRVFRGVLVDRGPIVLGANPITPMLDALDQGNSLILFPEGTRGDGKELRPFKHGIFHVARARPGVELVPVWIDNSYRVMPKGVILPLPLLCSVTFGQPAKIEAEEDHGRFLTRLRQSLLDLGGE